jgi:hypothetical protein
MTKRSGTFITCLATTFFQASLCLAVDHTRSVGEPYSLAGKRMMFTNWYYIRAGQVDWKDASGKSVYQGEVEAGPFDAHFEAHLAPHGIKLIAQPAERGKPILHRERPWEQMGISGIALIHDSGRYRLWGGAQQSKDKRFSCYFESTDGVNWERPDLGIVDYEGSKHNNLYVNPGQYVFIDPSAPEAERYKAVWAARTDPAIIAKYRETRPISRFAEEEDPGRFHSIRAAVSPDGFHWTELTEPISVEISDTQIIAYYDPDMKKYVMFTRGQLLGPRAAGEPKPTGRMHDFVGRRSIGRSESTDFRKFPLSDVIIEPGADMGPADVYYTNCKTTIPGAPDHHLLFPVVYHQDNDTFSIDVFSSSDSKTWTKLPGSPVLDTNTFGQWDGGCVMAFPNLIELRNGSFALPYTGFVYPHKYPRGAWGYDVGLAIWPKGRLIALEAADEGEFTTVAFIPPGKNLLVNALTKRAGFISIEVRDLDGNIVPGRSMDEATPIIGDQFRTPARWTHSTDLGVKEREPVMLRVRLKQAKLFGFDFD